MSSHRMRTTAVVLLGLAGSLSGCAGGVHLSGKTMCEAHGGTYAAESKQCSYPAQPPTRSASEICRMHGGEWDDVSDSCAIDDRSK